MIVLRPNKILWLFTAFIDKELSCYLSLFLRTYLEKYMSLANKIKGISSGYGHHHADQNGYWNGHNKSQKHDFNNHSKLQNKRFLQL